MYHINAVDEVTQWQQVATVRAISERCLLPVIERLIRSYPLVIRGFHTDNGSEYVNWGADRLLKWLQIDFTRSRARRSHVNALVESKNGSSIRTTLGCDHIPRLFDAESDVFVDKVLSPHLNYHHPCLFPTTEIDRKGRRRTRYLDQDVKAPFEKLASLPGVEHFLKPGVTLQQLEVEARARSDLDSAAELRRAQVRLFELIHRETRRYRPGPRTARHQGGRRWHP